ncbi:hypothetical protein UlMin_015556 [Ulmus minor]
MGGSVKNVLSKAELDNLVWSGVLVFLHFWSSWCEASKHMDQVFDHLSTNFPHAHFLSVEAEEQPEMSEAYSIYVVPFFVFAKTSEISFWWWASMSYVGSSLMHIGNAHSPWSMDSSNSVEKATLDCSIS